MTNEQLEMDCYQKADPKEGKFTLIGRDRTGPSLVRMWAAIRAGDTAEAVNQFNELIKVGEHYYGDPTEAPQLLNALQIAEQMENWRAENRI